MRVKQHRAACVRVLVAVGLATLLPAAGTAEADLFQSKVAGIFERRCVSCHNDGDRKGGLSLASADGLTKGGESGAVIDKDDFAASLLLQAIAGDEPQMPKEGEPLTVDEVAAIRKWIEAGATWPQDVRLQDKSLADLNWWSLKPIVRPELPSLDSDHAAIARTPIDRFVLAKLQENELSMSPQADRRTLIRRLYFDLLGLPPMPEEVAAFIGDDAPQAYERLVDRLLASPSYGERWARHWLDVVKYADTCGYDKDKLRPNAWPYRDYVIRSFNEDKPYSRFVREQVAGDVLFPGEADGILGLGFMAAGPWDFIGHVEVPETKIDGRIARHIDRDEMVSNTLNTFNSVTIQCCRCHNHKFDPFTQEHYYSLQAVFAAVDRADRPYDTDPDVERQRRELDERLKQSREELAKIDAAIKKEGGEDLAAVKKLIAELLPKAQPKGKKPEYGYHSNLGPDPNREKWVQVDLGREVQISKVILNPCHDEYANIGAGFGFPVRFRVVASLREADSSGKEEESTSRSDVTTLDDQTSEDFPNPALVPHEIKADSVKARYIRVTATKLGERTNDYMLALAELQVLDKDGNNIALKANVTATDSIEAPVRWARANLTDGIWPQAADPAAVRELGEAQAKQKRILAKINTPERLAARDKLSMQIDASTKQMASLPMGRMVYAAATHFATQGGFKPTMGEPRLIKLLHRGNILTPGDAVTPGTVPIFEGASASFNLPEDHNEGDRRTTLANWLTRDDHPLTWRSIVNRVWLYHFGKGIVESPNDFGRMGQLPSHPKLLDWLAAEFRDNGQSIKELHRLIVRSAVYRQASTENEKHAAIDSGNQYLWRMNRRRLEAEEIRDATLAVSGSLQNKMGGPGYYLFVLEKTAHSPHYEYHKFDPEDRASHRRSVYRFIARSQPDPFMTTLDCADSSQSTPKRNETLTSLRALSLLNNKFNLAMSQHFARRLQFDRDTLPEQIDRGMQLIAGRSPTEAEREQLVAYAEQHGIANCCRVLLNLSEFVFLD